MSTNTVVSVPDWAKAHVATYLESAYNLWLDGTISPYAGPVVASQTQYEADGIAGLADRARTGDAVIKGAIALVRDEINGEYLPGDKSEFVAARDLVLVNSATDFLSVSSRIGKKAMYVGDPDPTYLAKSLAAGYPAAFNARMGAAIDNDNYMKERALQDNALSFGVEMGKHSVTDAEMLRKSGLFVRQYLQDSYGNYHKLFTEQQEINMVKIEIFGNALRAITGSQQTSTSTDPKSNRLIGAVGGAATGAMAGAYIGAQYGSGGGPWGAVIGAVIGGVVGLFS